MYDCFEYLTNNTQSNLHAIFLQFSIPSHLATLPDAVGEPAGGSLTADQWLLLATVFAPIVVSIML